MEDRQKIKILVPTVCGAKPVKEGEVIGAGKADARLLIALGKAEAWSGTDEKGDDGGKGPEALKPNKGAKG